MPEKRLQRTREAYQEQPEAKALVVCFHHDFTGICRQCGRSHDIDARLDAPRLISQWGIADHMTVGAAFIRNLA